MNNQKTHITFVLDETGSMHSVKEQTISGFNEFLRSQEDKSLGETRVTLIKFNSEKIETVYSDALIEDVPNLTRDTYKPDSTTPLYDAVARAIKDTDDKLSLSSKVLTRLAGHKVAVPPLVLLVVMTDGLENASREYTRDDIFRMIEGKKKEGWAFAFLGSNQDSWDAAKPMGFAPGSIANYDQGNVQGAFAGISHAMSSYRKAASQLRATADNKADYMKSITALGKDFWQGKKEVTYTNKEENAL